jgi:RNA polymerase sigma factor (sigma-70 family)
VQLESALVLRAQAGQDREAFSRLVSLHQSRVRGFLLRLCHQTALADDLAQDTFLQAYRKLAGFRGSGSFNSWLLGIAYRCFLQDARSKGRARQIHAQYEQEEALRMWVEQMSPAQLDLERAMSRLGIHEAAAISLNISMGYSHAEVAHIMGLPLGSVKSYISRGLKKLRSQLETNSQERTS